MSSIANQEQPVTRPEECPKPSSACNSSHSTSAANAHNTGGMTTTGPEVIDLTSSSQSGARKHSSDEAEAEQGIARKRPKMADDNRDLVTTKSTSDSAATSGGSHSTMDKKIPESCPEKHISTEEAHKGAQLDYQATTLPQIVEPQDRRLDEASTARTPQIPTKAQNWVAEVQKFEVEAKNQADELRLDLCKERERSSQLAEEIDNLKSALEDQEARNSFIEKESNDHKKQSMDFEKQANGYKLQLDREKEESRALDIVNMRNCTHITNLESDFAALRKELKAAKARISKLSKEHDELSASFEDAEQQWQLTKTKMLRQLQDNCGLSQRFNFQVSDSQIIEAWKSLKHKISQFVDAHTNTSFNVTDDSFKRVVTMTTPNSLHYLASQMLYPSIFEAYIWDWLFRWIFNSKVDYEPDFLSKCLHMAGDIASSKIPRGDHELNAEYRAWRSSSWGFASRLPGLKSAKDFYHDKAASLVTKIAHVCGNGCNGNEILEMVDIASDARAMLMMFRKLKATYHINFSHLGQDGVRRKYGFPYAEDHMNQCPPLPDNLPNQQTSVVDMIISPALIKSGNNHGQDYSKSMCLVKMDVLCDVQIAGPPPKEKLDRVHTEQLHDKNLVDIPKPKHKQSLSMPTERPATETKGRESTKDPNKLKDEQSSRHTVVKMENGGPFEGLDHSENRTRLTRRSKEAGKAATAATNHK